jgi:hypothetical protein
MQQVAVADRTEARGIVVGLLVRETLKAGKHVYPTD